MPKRKLEDHVSRTFSVKCSLGRVLASTQANVELSSSLRSAIESSVDRIHTLAVKGTLIATDVVLRLAEEGKALPPVEVQSWWYKCIASTGKLRGKRLVCKDADIESSARRLFPGGRGVSGYGPPMAFHRRDRQGLRYRLPEYGGVHIPQSSL